ncbi:hypothetical protein JOC77_000906 [Peribacillus deserti]|uniref:Uncharacterized protein n=1 Tax=Peribacillus deserti TaxID=673318 RepID=A0ABS2QED0_9BACI|nr:hypothetical protein [Peribacillus deserti]
MARIAIVSAGLDAQLWGLFIAGNANVFFNTTGPIVLINFGPVFRFL